MMEQVLSALYGVSGVVACALYLPQILRYHRERAARGSISLLTWSGWIAVTCVTILYAAYVAKNTLFTAVAGLNAMAQVTVLAYGIAARLEGRGARSPLLTPGIGKRGITRKQRVADEHA